MPDLILRIPVKYPNCFGKMRTDYGGNNDMIPNWPCCECDAKKECEKKTMGYK